MFLLETYLFLKLSKLFCFCISGHHWHIMVTSRNLLRKTSILNPNVKKRKRKDLDIIAIRDTLNEMGWEPWDAYLLKMIEIPFISLWEENPNQEILHDSTKLFSNRANLELSTCSLMFSQDVFKVPRSNSWHLPRAHVQHMLKYLRDLLSFTESKSCRVGLMILHFINFPYYF